MQNFLIILVFLAMGCHSARFQLSESGGFNQDFRVVRNFDSPICPIDRIRVNPVFAELAIVVGSNLINSHNLLSGELLWSAPLVGGGTGAIAFTNDGHWTFVGTENGIHQFNTANGQMLKNFRHRDNSAERIHYTALSLSPDDRYLLAVGAANVKPKRFNIHLVGKLAEDFKAAKAQYEQVIQIWSAESGKLLRSAKISDSFIREVGFSPDAAMIFTSSYSNFRIQTSAKLATAFDFNIDASSLHSVASIIVSTAPTRDFRYVAVKTLGRTHLIATESGKIISNFPAMQSGPGWEINRMMRFVEFSQDDQVLETSDLDGIYASWTVPKGDLLSAGRSPGFGRIDLRGNYQRGVLSFEPSGKYVVETTPPQGRHSCKGFRIISLK